MKKSCQKLIGNNIRVLPASDTYTKDKSSCPNNNFPIFSVYVQPPRRGHLPI